MINFVLPIFAVILTGYLFACSRVIDKAGARLLNDYVLFVALPALLFIAVARADPAELRQWDFMGATLIGVAVAFLSGLAVIRFTGVRWPAATIPAMAASYGTTGYMGVPLLIAVLGAQAAAPAAIATILHNIPVIIAVILAHDLFAQRGGEGGSRGLAAIGGALKTTLTNPLTVAVVAGAFVSISGLPLPAGVSRFADFLGAAAGPSALFALGLGLAQLDAAKLRDLGRVFAILPLIAVKVLLQPLVMLLAGLYLFGMELRDMWFVCAVVMAAQPIGAGVFVFAAKYDYFEDETTIAIIASLLVTLVTLPLLLAFLVVA